MSTSHRFCFKILFFTCRNTYHLVIFLHYVAVEFLSWAIGKDPGATFGSVGPLLNRPAVYCRAKLMRENTKSRKFIILTQKIAINKYIRIIK